MECVADGAVMVQVVCTFCHYFLSVGQCLFFRLKSAGISVMLVFLLSLSLSRSHLFSSYHFYLVVLHLFLCKHLLPTFLVDVHTSFNFFRHLSSWVNTIFFLCSFVCCRATKCLVIGRGGER